MSKTKQSHTPGAWGLLETASLKQDGAVTIMLTNKTPHIHGILYGVSDADARLIAAAPDLLRSLTLLVSTSKCACAGPVKANTCTICIAKAVIKKAKGENQ